MHVIYQNYKLILYMHMTTHFVGVINISKKNAGNTCHKPTVMLLPYIPE